MLYYFSKTFTSTLSGSVVKQVTCYKCRGQFFYQLARIASATASAPYAIGQAAALARAQKGAAKKLERMLRNDSELVPCPHCGHMQEFMLRHQRSRMYRGVFLLTWLVPVVGLPLAGAVALARWSAHPRRFTDENHNNFFIVAAIFVVVPIVLLIVRRFLVMRLGQRGNERLLQEAMQGAPPPLLPAQQPDASGRIPLIPAPGAKETEAADSRFVVFPLLRIALPPVCCECLKPCSTFYRSLMNSGGSEKIQVPLCPECFRRVRGRGWRGFAITALMAFSAASLLAMVPAKMDLAGP